MLSVGKARGNCIQELHVHSSLNQVTMCTNHVCVCVCVWGGGGQHTHKLFQEQFVEVQIHCTSLFSASRTATLSKSQ